MGDSSDLRVSDQDREQAASEIREHYAAGRLDDDELSDRLEAIYGARTEGELREVRRDLPALPVSVAAQQAAQRAELAERRHQLQRRLLQQTGGGLTPFLICTFIWASSGASGFFWPAFVLLAVLVPLVRNGWRLYGPAPEFDRVEAELDRSQRHRNRHARQVERRARRHHR